MQPQGSDLHTYLSTIMLITVLLWCVPQQLCKQLLQHLRAYIAEWGCLVTFPKQVLQRSPGSPQKHLSFSISDSPLAWLSHFKYLRSILSEDCCVDLDVQNQIKQASSSFGRLRNWVFCNRNLNLSAKVAVYQSVCLSTLLYACETWTLYSRNLKQLE